MADVKVSFDGGATVEVMVAGGPNSRESEVMEIHNGKNGDKGDDDEDKGDTNDNPDNGLFQIYNPASDTWRAAASFDHTAFGPGCLMLF